MRERGGGEEGGGSERGEGEKVSEGVLALVAVHSWAFIAGGARCVFVLVGRHHPSVVSCRWRLASFCSMMWPLTGGMPFCLESGDAGGASGQSRVVVAC